MGSVTGTQGSAFLAPTTAGTSCSALPETTQQATLRLATGLTLRKPWELRKDILGEDISRRVMCSFYTLVNKTLSWLSGT